MEHVFQVWNEPNLSLDLNPVSASTYRGMVNAVADAVHAVDPANLVVAGALDPFGHPKSKKQKWYSVAPLAYMRSLLCLSKGAHPHATCHNPVHFDVWSHHPYTFGGPFGHAKNPGRRRARRSAEDAGAAEGRREAPPRRLGAARSVLGDRVRLGHEPAAEARGVAQPRRPLDGGVAASDVAVGRIAGDVVPARGLPEPEPVPERPLLPLVVARERASQADAGPRSGSPSSRISKKSDGQRLGPRRDERSGGRDDPAPARQERRVADRRALSARIATASSRRPSS